MSPRKARLQVGQRVRLTEQGKKLGLQGRAKTTGGIVTSFRAGWLAVRRDGIQAAECYADGLWEGA